MSLENKMLYAEQFSRFLQIPTVTDTSQEEFDKLHALLQEFAPEFYANTTLYKPRKNALIFKWEGQKHDRPLVLMGHQDVVPEGDPAKWKYPPYSGAIAEDRIWGRGALDCKCMVYGSAVAANELIKEGFKPEQDIYFCYGDDEENHGGGAAAEAAFLKDLGVKPVLVLDEGGGMAAKDGLGSLSKLLVANVGVMGVCEKGFADIRFYARSKGGHSSMPPKNTPFVRLAKFILYCEKHNIFDKKVQPVVKEMLNGISKGVKPILRPIIKYAYLFVGIATKVLPASLAGELKAFLQTTMVFTQAKGADASNNIPDAAYVLANLRYSPQEGKDKVIPKLEKIAKKWDIEIDVDNSRDASPIADWTTAEYKFAVDMINKTYGPTAMAPYLIAGGTDCREMQMICKTALRFTPFLVPLDELSRCHGYDECIGIDSLAKGIDYYKNVLTSFK